MPRKVCEEYVPAHCHTMLPLSPISTKDPTRVGGTGTKAVCVTNPSGAAGPGPVVVIPGDVTSTATKTLPVLAMVVGSYRLSPMKTFSFGFHGSPFAPEVMVRGVLISWPESSAILGEFR